MPHERELYVKDVGDEGEAAHLPYQPECSEAEWKDPRCLL